MLHLSQNPFRVWLLDNFSLTDRKPGDIECITDIFFEDFKNFPQTRELGEESARFVREEMEKTWGDSRLTVLAEDEAQRWILGVISITSILNQLHTPDKWTQASCFSPEHSPFISFLAYHLFCRPFVCLGWPPN